MNYITYATYHHKFEEDIDKSLIGFKSKDGVFMLPWEASEECKNSTSLKELIKIDMSYYKNLTKNNYNIMGFNTYQSLPKQMFKNHLDRTFIVITTRWHDQQTINLGNNSKIMFYTMKGVLGLLKETASNWFKHSIIIGGAKVFEQFFELGEEYIDIIREARYTFEDKNYITNSDLEPIYLDKTKLFEKFNMQIANNKVLISASAEDFSYHLREINFYKTY